MPRFNVYLISIDTLKAIKLIASEVDSDTAEIAEHSKYKDRLNEFIAGYEVGSQRDLELANDLK